MTATVNFETAGSLNSFIFLKFRSWVLAAGYGSGLGVFVAWRLFLLCHLAPYSTLCTQEIWVDAGCNLGTCFPNPQQLSWMLGFTFLILFNIAEALHCSLRPYVCDWMVGLLNRYLITFKVLRRGRESAKHHFTYRRILTTFLWDR